MFKDTESLHFISEEKYITNVCASVCVGENIRWEIQHKDLTQMKNDPLDVHKIIPNDLSIILKWGIIQILYIVSPFPPDK